MEKEKQKYNLIQRVTFIFGGFVLVGLISLLIFEMSQQGNTPPNLEISMNQKSLEPQNSFQVVIQNHGEETAENVEIHLNLYQDGRLSESGTIAINYIPPGSRTEAWIVFHTSSTPEDSLAVSSVTYVIP